MCFAASCAGRCARCACLGYGDPALPHLLPIARDCMSPSYPEVEADFERISTYAYAEEEAFLHTLRSGTTIFDTAVSEAKSSGRVAAVRREGVSAARHVRLSDRDHARDGG